ncbi:hypothetical protein Tco_0693302 [Tanacetum coccineum]
MDNNAASWSNGLKLSCLKVEDLKGYNPFTRIKRLSRHDDQLHLLRHSLAVRDIKRKWEISFNKHHSKKSPLGVPLVWLYSIEPLSSSVLALGGDREALFGSLRGLIQRNVP